MVGMNVNIKHCYRQQNMAADWLAKKAVHGRTTIMYDPEPGLAHVLAKDNLGFLYPRII